MITYPLVFGGATIVWILLLLRLLCRERVKDLNLESGSIKRDLVHGLILFAIFFAFMFVDQATISRMLPRAPSADFTPLLEALRGDPLVLLLWFGPVVWIGVAAFEELTLVFLISRLLEIWPSLSGKIVAIILASLLFAVAHLYQGPAGMVSIGVLSLFAGVYYVHWGRVMPLIIAHALFDSFGIGMALVMTRST
jgi:membrane protease YdiL (CAAX protease family)